MRILITAGPTREYLDDVRYLSNASSGKMGYGIARAARDHGHAITLVSGPVDLPPPEHIEVIQVETTQQMLSACRQHFSQVDGVIAAAAVCDYKPAERVAGKMSKTGEPISVSMIETDDVLASLGKEKQHQWIIGFALEAQNPRENALQKLRRKNCDWIILNHPSAIGSSDNDVFLLGSDGEEIAHWQGTKTAIAEDLVNWLDETVSPSQRDERRSRESP